MAKPKNYIVILAGGGGTRLWPKSRIKTPKQFLRLINNKSLFQATVDRVRNKFSHSHIYVVAAKELIPQIKKEAPQLPHENILVEPSAKNTAAAAGLAAIGIFKKDPDAIISTLAADHYIKEKNKFLNILSVAQKAAAKGNYIVAIGLRPTYAHTGFGYIHAKDEAFRIDETPVFKVNSFKEKPDQDTVQTYFSIGGYFWNANINSYKVRVLLSALDKHHSDLSRILKKIGLGASEKTIDEAWRRLPSEPIDTVVLEKAKNVLMVPGDFSWFDVGDWNTVYNILSSIPSSNVIIEKGRSNHIGFDTKGCLFYGGGRMIATIGVKDLVIIDTPDALLVCPKNRSQEVKKLVEKLASGKKRIYL